MPGFTDVLDTYLVDREYLCDQYSIADIANWCWAITHEGSGVSISGLGGMQAWLGRIGRCPAVLRGRLIPERRNRSELKKSVKKQFWGNHVHKIH